MRKKVKTEVKKKGLSRRVLKDNLQLGVLTLPAVILMLVFSYLPMFGIVIAFKDYKVTGGILGSEWATPIFKNFEFFFESAYAWRVIRNTLGLNLLFIVVGIVASVAFALIMFEVKKPRHIKAYQTFAILPHFLSWVAVSYIVYALLDADKGMINRLLIAFGGEKINWYSNPAYWPVILLLVKLWHGVGLSSIVYYASLMSVDNELFEAAEMDGAGKWRKIIHISIPHLVPIVTLMTILDIGGIFRSDFGLFYNVTRNIGNLYDTTDVIDTYVYRALMENGNIGMSSAVSFVQSVVCFATIMITNTIVKKIEPEYTLF